MKTFDTIVVGLGAMGSATACHLALRGQRVLGIEQFQPNHTHGSSHGDSRIIRESYFEHPSYVPLVQRAYELWRELETRTGMSLMNVTGGLMMGPSGSRVVTGTIASAQAHALPYEVLTPARVRTRFPWLQLGENDLAVWDANAGFVRPEVCMRAHVRIAQEHGAAIRLDEQLLEWAPDSDAVWMRTNRAEYTAARLVLACGAWMRDLLQRCTAADARLQLPLEIERQVVVWFENPGVPDEMPIYAYEFSPGLICYGFPPMEHGVKAAIMHGGEILPDASRVRRETGEEDLEELRSALRSFFPSLASAGALDASTCLFTNTPDQDFIVDLHPRYPQVLISSPCSGHGFKFASAIGEAQAELITTGECTLDLSPFAITRFGDV